MVMRRALCDCCVGCRCRVSVCSHVDVRRWCRRCRQGAYDESCQGGGGIKYCFAMVRACAVRRKSAMLCTRKRYLYCLTSQACLESLVAWHMLSRRGGREISHTTNSTHTFWYDMSEKGRARARVWGGRNEDSSVIRYFVRWSCAIQLLLVSWVDVPDIPVEGLKCPAAFEFQERYIPDIRVSNRNTQERRRAVPAAPHRVGLLFRGHWWVRPAATSRNCRVHKRLKLARLARGFFQECVCSPCWLVCVFAGAGYCTAWKVSLSIGIVAKFSWASATTLRGPTPTNISLFTRVYLDFCKSRDIERCSHRQTFTTSSRASPYITTMRRDK